MNFDLFPRDILDSNILPLLSYLDLGRLSQVSVGMLRVVENYLNVYSSLDMAQVTSRLHPAKVSSLDMSQATSRLHPAKVASLDMTQVTSRLHPAKVASLDMAQVTSRLHPAKVALAFNFLTKGSSSLRRLTINESAGMEVASLETLRRVLRKNQNLQFVTLINVKLTSSVMRAILELDNLKTLEISPEICPGVKFTNILEEIVKKGCQVIHHHPERSNFN